MRHIVSRDNSTVKRLHALAHSARDRRKLGETVLDGDHLIVAALAAGFPLREVVASEQALGKPEIAALLERVPSSARICLPDALFAHVSPVDAPTGVLAVIEPPMQPPAMPHGSVVVLDAVQDSGNLGTILRTAAAAGVRDALLTAGCAQAWSPRVLRAGMGAHFAMRIVEQAEPAVLLRAFPGQVLATLPAADARPLYELDLTGPVAWLFGAEGQGLSPGVAALATVRVTIPMPGVTESLNVAAAAAVCMFEQVRQMRAAST